MEFTKNLKYVKNLREDIKIYHISSYDFIQITDIRIDYTHKYVNLISNGVLKFFMTFNEVSNIPDYFHRFITNYSLNEVYYSKKHYMENLYNLIKENYPDIIY